MGSFYEQYKTLRNLLRTQGLLNSLGTIRWYVNYLQLRDPPSAPSDIEVHDEFYQKSLELITPWDLSILAREVIINSSELYADQDLRQWKYLAGALNGLKKVDKFVTGEYLNQGNILHFVSKALAHQQFVWQENRPNYDAYIRYYSIYRQPVVKEAFEGVFGLELDKFFLFSVLLWSKYTTHFGFTYPPEMEMGQVTIDPDDYDNFLKQYALPLEELKERLIKEHQLNQTFAYYFDSLKRFPLILTELDGIPSHVCPIPTYLFWRNTDGIYYDIIDSLKVTNKAALDAFWSALGDAYSSYVGEMLEQQPYNREVRIVDADKHISFKDSKPDWFIIDGQTALFIECKTKRMLSGAKTDFDFSPTTQQEVEKMAAMVLQTYKGIVDARKRSDQFLGGIEKMYPIVVTMENWFLFGDLSRELRKAVEKLLIKASIDVAIMEDCPYMVLSCAEFETFVVVLRSHEASSIIGDFLSDKETRDWALRSHLVKNYSQELGVSLLPINHLDTMLSRLTGLDMSER